MLDWLKYFPFEWHDDHKPSEVRGPYFAALKPRKWRLNDCTLYFKAPRSNPVFGFSRRGSSVDALSPGRAEIVSGKWQRIYNSGSDAPPNRWQFDRFYSNTWYFVGPWFTGYQADLSVSALLLTVSENNELKDKDLFHPRIFEAAVVNYLDTVYGYDKNGLKPSYRGPLNWRALPISNSIQAVVCDVHHIGNSSKDNPTLHRLVYFPITPKKLIQINFNFGGTAIYQDEVRAKPQLELCNSIIDSMRLDVGPETQAAWDKVKATCPDMSITDTFGELPWPLSIDTHSGKRKEVDITRSSQSGAPSKVERKVD